MYCSGELQPSQSSLPSLRPEAAFLDGIVMGGAYRLYAEIVRSPPPYHCSECLIAPIRTAPLPSDLRGTPHE